jgi:BTB/POZ domain
MAPPPPHKVTARDFGTGTILVQVGPSETREDFVIHRRLLESASEYFRGLFESFFIEKSNEKLELFHNDPKVFSTFVDWLYLGQVDEGPVYMKDDTCEDTFRLRLYVMADYFQCENLHREAMNRL